jgi:hypothetical protein
MPVIWFEFEPAKEKSSRALSVMITESEHHKVCVEEIKRVHSQSISGFSGLIHLIARSPGRVRRLPLLRFVLVISGLPQFVDNEVRYAEFVIDLWVQSQVLLCDGWLNYPLNVEARVEESAYVSR